MVIVLYVDFSNYFEAYDKQTFRNIIAGIWHAYIEFFIPTDYVARSGYYLCGVYPEPEHTTLKLLRRQFPDAFPESDPELEIKNLMPLTRAQSGTEHTASVMWWANNICANFPRIVTLGSMRSDLVDVLQIHDLFESKIGGDIPDVFGPNAAKDEAEAKFAASYVYSFYNLPHYLELQANFNHMQKKDNTFGQIAYCFDKLDAVLRGFAYEVCGCTGIIGGKGFKTDEECIAITGTNNICDGWFMSTIIKIQEYPCSNFFIQVMAEVYYLVRGNYPEWLNKVKPYRFLQ